MSANGDYRPVREIARGGMGAIIDTRDRKLGRSVAMKVMLQRDTKPEVRGRFLQEARVLGQLAHPNIVPIHDLGTDDQGRVFYTMKLVQGMTLHQVISRLRMGDPDVRAHYPLNTLLTIFQKICDAVSFAHSKGVIHRDLKPHNIMVGEFGEVLVMDWGLAKLLPGSPAEEMPSGSLPVREHASPPDTENDEFNLETMTYATLPPSGMPISPADATIDEDSSSSVDQADFPTPESTCLTLEGTVLGTPSYMSPEQAGGSVNELDARSDIYSLGAILYAILALRPAIEGDSVEAILANVRSGAVTPPSDLESTPSSNGQEPKAVAEKQLPHCPGGRVPLSLSAVTMKAMARERQNRYSDVPQLAADISAYQNGFATSAENAGLLRQIALLLKRHRTVAALGSMVILLLAGAGIIGPAVAIRQNSLRQSADNARSNAVSTAASLHRHLVAMHVKQGNQQLIAGDPVAALPWYAAALELDKGDAATEWPHRFRMGAVLAEIPRPVWLGPMGSEKALPALSHDGRFIAVGGVGQISVWNLETGTLWFQKSGYGDAALEHLQFCEDDSRLFCARSRNLYVWDLGSRGEEQMHQRLPTSIARFKAGPQGQRAVIALRDGRNLLHDVEQDQTIRFLPQSARRALRVDANWKTQRALIVSDMDHADLLDLESGTLVRRLQHDARLTWGEFDEEGRQIATSSEDNTARVWNAQTGEAVGSPMKHPDRVRIARFNRSGTRIATGSWDSAARVWDIKSSRLTAGPMSHRNSIGTVDFSPDGQRLVTGSHDHTARIWNTETGEPVSPPMRHGFVVVNVSFLPSGKRLMTASAERVVRVWEPNAKGLQLAKLNHGGSVKTARLSPGGETVVTASTDGTAKLWDLESGKPKPWTLEHEASLREADFSPNGKHLVTSGDGGQVRIWSTMDGQPVTPFLEHEGTVWHAEFSRDSRLLLTAGERSVSLWSVPDAELLHRVKPAGNRIVQWATFDAHNRQFLACADDGSATVWNVATGAQIGVPLRHELRIESGGFSPDGKFVVTASLDHSARIWHAATGRQIGKTMQHAAGVHRAWFAAGGRLVVTGARDGTARIWDARTGAPTSPPLSIGTGLVRPAVSADNRLIATAGGLAGRLWDFQSGEFLGILFPHDSWTQDIQFSADSQRLVTASDDGTAGVWRIPQPSAASVESLLNLSALISGHRVKQGMGLEPLTPEELVALFNSGVADDRLDF